MTAASPTSSERMIEPELLITGEAVALEITPATVANRITSGLIDYAVYALGAGLSVVVVMVLAISTGSEFRENLALTRAMLSLALLAWMVVIPLLVELLSGGRSLGRMVTGARVVRDDGGAITARHSAVRVGVGILENWLMWGGLAFFVELFNKKGKRLGDLAAGTMVCSQGDSVFYPPLVMPPGLQDWARTATILPLDDALAAEARAFLGTNRGIAPKLRGEVASSLADRLVKRVQTPLPPGLHPEIVIAAILVARRDREWERERERRARGKARFHEATQARFGL